VNVKVQGRVKFLFPAKSFQVKFMFCIPRVVDNQYKTANNYFSSWVIQKGVSVFGVLRLALLTRLN
jgi:hypothetical protein